MSRHTKLIRRARTLFYTVLGLGALGILTVVVLFFVMLKDLPRVPDPLSRIIEKPSTEIYTASGELVLRLGGRDPVPLDRISPRFKEAIVAIEDHRFWSHHGIDKIRLTKVFLDRLLLGKRMAGTSTITQQLAKNLFFTLDRSPKRKFLEALVSFQIESKYSKEDILEAYINNTSFGVNALGIEQASHSFFGKPASDLTLAEASLLAGLPKSPSGYNPYLHMDEAKKRQRDVLASMVSWGYISREEADTAFEEPLDLRPRKITDGNYFLDFVVQDLEERYTPDVVYNGGLRVTITLDEQLQRWGTEAVQKGMDQLDRLIGLPQDEEVEAEDTPQAALVAIDAKTGAVKAIIGGRDYLKTQHNRAIRSRLQPGSGFKPFLYYTALESLDINPTTVFVDRKITIPIKGAPDWTPENYGKKFMGPLILKSALMNSVNTIAAQLIERTGPESVIDTAQRCGITSPLEPVYAIALGAEEVSPLEMASAYSVFASGGVRHKPFWIWRVEDSTGRILEEHIISGEKTLDPVTVYQLVDMMKGVVDEKTPIRSLGFTLPAAGKTGTTNDSKAAWFTGFTPNLSVSVWTGYDIPNKLKDKNGVGFTGSRAAAPIWADFMLEATQGEPARNFTVPPGIHFETVDATTGYLTEEGAPNALRVALKEGQDPEPMPEGYYPSIMTDQESEGPGLDEVDEVDVVE